MKREELYLNGQDDFGITISSANVKTYKLNKGERITLPKKCARLCVAISGEFSFATKHERPQFKVIDRSSIFLLCEENQVFESRADKAEILIAEFEVVSDNLERVTQSELHGIYALWKEEDRKLLNIFLDELEEFEDNSQILKCWLALLVTKIRKEYIRAYKSTLENQNGAIFFGTAPKGCGELNLCITDAFLIVTDKQNDEKRAIKFHCEYRFLEVDKDNSSCETLHFDDNPEHKFASLRVKENYYFKIWFFPENPDEVLNVSPFTHTLKLTFSIKTNVPCAIDAGISNITDYERVCCKVESESANTWHDFLLLLFGWDSEEKINGYIQKIMEYIDENFNKKITVPALAQMVHLHPNYLSRIFKEYMGCSISSYVNNRRIGEAKRMLAETNKTVASIAAATGFYDSHHLQKCFKLYTGLTPTDYKAKL